jgi:protein TonB
VRRIVGAQSVLYDPLPRSGGWPLVLLAAAGMLAVLRLHAPATSSAPSLFPTNPAFSATTLADPVAPLASAAAPLAAADLATTNAAERREVVAPVVVHPAAADTTPGSEAVPGAPVVETPVARPKITLAALAPRMLPRVADIRQRLVAAPALPATPVALDDQPQVTRRVQPEYPIREKLRGVTGRVELQFAIEADGSVGEVSVLNSDADHVFDRVAINALKRWQFAGPGEPGRLYTQAFSFTLGAPVRAGETCREVTGSHICRYGASGEEGESVVPGVLELGSRK